MNIMANIYLVIAYINKETGKRQAYYLGEHDPMKCLMKVSFRASHNTLGVPLWFDTAQEAQEYIQKSESDTEVDTYCIQEFTYPDNSLVATAKIVFNCKSDTAVIMEDGKTESVPNIWAYVRTFSICDKKAAEDYVRRFNGDANAAYEVRRKA